PPLFPWRRKSCSLTLEPRKTATGYFSMVGRGSGALLTTVGFGFAWGDAIAPSESRDDGVAPGVLTSWVSLRLRWTSISLPSAWARGRRWVCAGVGDGVTVVFVTGLLSLSPTVWPAASTVTSCRITLAIFSGEPCTLGMLTSTSTRLFGRRKPLSLTASSSLI